MSSVKAPAAHVAGQLYNFCAHKIDSLVFNCPPNETWRFERNQRNAGKGLMRPTRDAFFSSDALSQDAEPYNEVGPLQFLREPLMII